MAHAPRWRSAGWATSCSNSSLQRPSLPKRIMRRYRSCVGCFARRTGYADIPASPSRRVWPSLEQKKPSAETCAPLKCTKTTFPMRLDHSARILCSPGDALPAKCQAVSQNGDGRYRMSFSEQPTGACLQRRQSDHVDSSGRNARSESHPFAPVPVTIA